MRNYIKRIGALLLALIMVLAMCIPAFAETMVPNENDKTTVSIIGLEPDVTLTKYQIVDAVYDTQGFKSYKWTDIALNAVKELSTQSIFVNNSFSLTQQQLADIAAYINNNKIEGSELISNKTEVEVGTWLVLASGGSKIYNPMIASVFYGPVDNDGNYVYSEPFNPKDGWTLTTDDIYAKVSEISFDKSVDNIDVETLSTDNKTVNYKIVTKIPSYSSEYESPVFRIKDAMKNISLDEKSIRVEVNNNVTEQYELNIFRNESGDTFDITFKPDYLLSLAGEKVQPEVVITYSGTVKANIGNWVPAENEALLTYSNNPGSTDEKLDKTATYSFNINGEIIKTDSKNPLSNAVFGLYYDEECKNLYQQSAATKKDGYVLFNGLEGKTGADEKEAKVYYMKEIKAPEGFSVSNEIYKVEIIPDYSTEKDNTGAKNDLYMNSYEVKISQKDKVIGSVIHTFEDGKDKVSGTPADILNTPLSSLPSTGGIGTYIFTIVGVVIMAVAAGLMFIKYRKSLKEE